MTQDYWENLYQQVGSGIGKIEKTVQATLFEPFKHALLWGSLGYINLSNVLNDYESFFLCFSAN